MFRTKRQFSIRFGRPDLELRRAGLRTPVHLGEQNRIERRGEEERPMDPASAVGVASVVGVALLRRGPAALRDTPRELRPAP